MSFEDYVNSLNIQSSIAIGLALERVTGKFDSAVKFGSSPVYLRWGFATPPEQGRGIGEGLPTMLGSTSEHRMRKDAVAAWVREVLKDPEYAPSLQDLLDVEFCALGNMNIYDAYVVPWLQNQQPTTPGSQSPGVGGADPCADVKAQLQGARDALAAAVAVTKGLDAKLRSIEAASDKARRALPAGAGGGKYAAALRALVDAIDTQVRG